MVTVIIHFWRKQRETHFPQRVLRCVFNLVKFDAIINFTINHIFAHLITTKSGFKASDLSAASRRTPPTSSGQRPASCQGPAAEAGPHRHAPTPHPKSGLRCWHREPQLPHTSHVYNTASSLTLVHHHLASYLPASSPHIIRCL